MRVLFLLLSDQLEKLVSTCGICNWEEYDLDEFREEIVLGNLLNIMLSKHLDVPSLVPLEMQQLIQQRLLYLDKLTNINLLIVLIRKRLINQPIEEELQLLHMLLTGRKHQERLLHQSHLRSV